MGNVLAISEWESRAKGRRDREVEQKPLPETAEVTWLSTGSALTRCLQDKNRGETCDLPVPETVLDILDNHFSLEEESYYKVRPTISEFVLEITSRVENICFELTYLPQHMKDSIVRWRGSMCDFDFGP